MSQAKRIKDNAGGVKPTMPINTVSAKKPSGDIEDDCLYASVSSFERPQYDPEFEEDEGCNESSSEDQEQVSINQDFIITASLKGQRVDTTKSDLKVFQFPEVNNTKKGAGGRYELLAEAIKRQASNQLNNKEMFKKNQQLHSEKRETDENLISFQNPQLFSARGRVLIEAFKEEDEEAQFKEKEEQLKKQLNEKLFEKLYKQDSTGKEKYLTKNRAVNFIFGQAPTANGSSSNEMQSRSNKNIDYHPLLSKNTTSNSQRQCEHHQLDTSDNNNEDYSNQNDRQQMISSDQNNSEIQQPTLIMNYRYSRSSSQYNKDKNKLHLNNEQQQQQNKRESSNFHQQKKSKNITKYTYDNRRQASDYFVMQKKNQECNSYQINPYMEGNMLNENNTKSDMQFYSEFTDLHSQSSNSSKNLQQRHKKLHSLGDNNNVNESVEILRKERRNMKDQEDNRKDLSKFEKQAQENIKHIKFFVNSNRKNESSNASLILQGESNDNSQIYQEKTEGIQVYCSSNNNKMSSKGGELQQNKRNNQYQTFENQYGDEEEEEEDGDEQQNSSNNEDNFLQYEVINEETVSVKQIEKEQNQNNVVEEEQPAFEQWVIDRSPTQQTNRLSFSPIDNVTDRHFSQEKLYQKNIQDQRKMMITKNQQQYEDRDQRQQQNRYQSNQRSPIEGEQQYQEQKYDQGNISQMNNYQNKGVITPQRSTTTFERYQENSDTKLDYSPLDNNKKQILSVKKFVNVQNDSINLVQRKDTNEISTINQTITVNEKSNFIQDSSIFGKDEQQQMNKNLSFCPLQQEQQQQIGRNQGFNQLQLSNINSELSSKAMTQNLNLLQIYNSLQTDQNNQKKQDNIQILSFAPKDGQFPTFIYQQQQQQQQQPFFGIQNTSLNQISNQQYTNTSGYTQNNTKSLHDQSDIVNQTVKSDVDQSYIILQYEFVLQRVNQEFHNILTKSNYYEDLCKQQEFKLSQTSELMREMREGYERQMQVLKQQDELKTIKCEELEFGIKRLKVEMEEMKSERMCLIQKINQTSHTQNLYTKNEEELLKKIDTLLAKINDQDKLLREREELNFQLNRNKMNLLCDIKNLKSAEQILKEENQQLNQNRLEQDDKYNELKNQNFTQQGVIRKMEGEYEYLRRELQNLHQEKMSHLHEIEDLKNQLQNEKQQSKDLEMKSSLQMQKIQYEKSGIDKENQRLNELIMQLSTNNNSSHPITRNVSFTHNSTNNNNSSFTSKNYQQPIQLRQDQRNQENGRSQLETSYFQMGRGHSSQRKLQEDQNSPQSKVSSRYQRKKSVSNQSFFNQDNQNNEQFENKRSPNQRNSKYAFNKNVSQLQDVFNWKGQNEDIDNNNNNQSKGNLSTVRKNILDDQFGSQGTRNNNRKLQNICSAEKLVENIKQRQQSDHNSILAHNSQFLNKQKTTLQEGGVQRITFPSCQNQLDQKEIIEKFDQQLQSLYIEKQKLESEYQKLQMKGSTTNALSVKKRREIIEFDLELNNKNISHVKTKLKELNAL